MARRNGSFSSSISWRQWWIWLLIASPRIFSLAPQPQNRGISRRNALLIGPAVVASVSLTQLPRASSAATATTEGVTTVSELLARLKEVPTFCIVNKDGAAYMIVKADERMAKGYAFTTYNGAKIVLEDAKKTATEKGYGDIWEDATITTIPADAAVRLSLTKKERTSQKDQSLGTMLRIIPSAEDREDGMLMDKNKFQDQGKVPLFYFDQLDDDRTLLYFNKKDLLLDWNKKNPGGKLPPSPKVLDLLELFQNTLSGRTEGLPRNIYFVPLPSMVEEAKDLKAKGLTPYKIDRMIV